MTRPRSRAPSLPRRRPPRNSARLANRQAQLQPIAQVHRRGTAGAEHAGHLGERCVTSSGYGARGTTDPAELRRPPPRHSARPPALVEAAHAAMSAAAQQLDNQS